MIILSEVTHTEKDLCDLSQIVSEIQINTSIKQKQPQSFPGGPVVENPPTKAGDTGSIPASGRFPHALR